MTKLFKAGDRVMLSRGFLQSTGQLTGEVPFQRGQVLRVEGARPQVVTIDWGRRTSKAVAPNLILENERHLEPQ